MTCKFMKHECLASQRSKMGITWDNNFQFSPMIHPSDYSILTHWLERCSMKHGRLLFLAGTSYHPSWRMEPVSPHKKNVVQEKTFLGWNAGKRSEEVPTFKLQTWLPSAIIEKKLGPTMQIQQSFIASPNLGVAPPSNSVTTRIILAFSVPGSQRHPTHSLSHPHGQFVTFLSPEPAGCPCENVSPSNSGWILR